MDTLIKYLLDYYVESSQRIFDVAADVIDIFFIGNDFGSQIGPLKGSDLFQRFVLPHLRRLIHLGHDYNLLVQLHCCGGFAPLIPMLIDAGLDGLHAVKPSCVGMDLRTLNTDFGNRIIFNSVIDSHHVLINGIPETVVNDTRKVLDIMPTSLELSGVLIPSHIQFKSLMPLIKGKPDRNYESIYGGYRDLQRMITNGDYKLIYYPKIDKTLLYNLKDDSPEMKNLADDPRYKGIIKNLHAKLKELQKETGDDLVIQKN